MFKPIFKITPEIVNNLVRLEAIKQEIHHLPINPTVLNSLRHTARIDSTHYSTMIEGNRLTENEVIQTIKKEIFFPNRERDQKEVLGYYAALDEVYKLASNSQILKEQEIKKLHAIAMSAGNKKVKPTAYRTGQNVIRESGTHAIVYLPPEAADVSDLMEDLIEWINTNPDNLLCPLVAAIAHYQYATIHPYYDGNGRTARLLATLILHRCGYDLKGIYSLDEYYAKDLPAYYQALTIGPSHNYYMGRAQADITQWIEYFCAGMVESFENVQRQAVKASKKGFKDNSSTNSCIINFVALRI